MPNIFWLKNNRLNIANLIYVKYFDSKSGGTAKDRLRSFYDCIRIIAEMTYDCLWPSVIFPTNGGQLDQAIDESSKANGAT
jgi:uncharacterized radical SAM superfamily protein